jgi:nicotinamidase-related amidase
VPDRSPSLRRRLFGEAPPPRLRRDNTALVVVDMQYFDAHPDWGEGKTIKQVGAEAAFSYYFDRLQEIIPNVQALLATSRQAGIEVIHLRVSELTEDSRDVGRKQAVRGLFVPRSSKEADLLEEVAAEGDEIVISKSSSGVFAWTNLDRVLQTMGIENLVFCGTSTNGCVESAVKDAEELGYRNLLVSDACAAGSAAGHEAALARLDGGPNVVVNTAEMTARIAELGLEPVPARRQALAEHLAAPPTPANEAVDDPYRLIFGEPPRPSLDPATTALLLLDVQRLTADRSGTLWQRAEARDARETLAPYFERVDAIRPAVADLLALCRRAGVEVIHARVAELTRDSRDAGPRQRAYGLSVPRGSADAEIVAEATPLDDEIVLDRSGAALFPTTNAERLLRNLGVRTVLIAGTSIDGGIEATIRNAADRDWDVVLVEDASALFWHLDGVRGMVGGLTTVMTVAELAAAFPVSSGSSSSVAEAGSIV